MPDDAPDYAMRCIMQQCGPEIANMVAPASIFALVLEVIAELQERIDALAARVPESDVDEAA